MIPESLQSCIYEGTVSHRRFSPVDNCFDYTTFMMYIDLDELPSLFEDRLLWSSTRPAPAWFCRDDYHAEGDLKTAVLDTVQRHLGIRPDGAVRMLAHLRYFGFCFNPVSFYFCFGSDGKLRAIMSEITNTPWGERHVYCMMWKPGSDQQRFDFDKQFHVSPFMSMDVRYDWRFSVPGDALNVFMANEKEGDKVFDATLRLSRRDMTPRRLNTLLLRHPFHTGKVVGGIYWQAMKLKLKGSPFYDHPEHDQQPHGDTIHGRNC